MAAIWCLFGLYMFEFFMVLTVSADCQDWICPWCLGWSGSQCESRWVVTWQVSTPPSGYPAHSMLEVMLYSGNQCWHWSWSTRGTSASWRMSGREPERDRQVERQVKGQTVVCLDVCVSWYLFVLMFACLDVCVSVTVCLCLTLSVSSPPSDETFSSCCEVLTFRW